MNGSMCANILGQSEEESTDDEGFAHQEFKKRPAPDSGSAHEAKRPRKAQSNLVHDSHQIKAEIQKLIAAGWKFPGKGRFWGNH